ncbi:MAG: protein kinase [Gemmatimonadota bacterium]
MCDGRRRPRRRPRLAARPISGHTSSHPDPEFPRPLRSVTPDAVARLSSAVSDRYQIERELGQGGMATVYLAQDLRHDRLVALKVLKPELAAVIGAERFVQEIKTTAALQHPHILPLFDSGTADGFLYYVMPYIQGETLRSKLDRESQLGVADAVRITTDVADALEYAHRHNVVHRDIKPENILLHDGRPMVADFGIALALSAAAGGRMTETGMSLGTPHYMSPEQATAEKEITGRSDIYSLGSVLYEMLSGQPPHLGGSAQQIIMKIIAEDAQPVTRLRKSVPANVAAAVSRSLEKLPADRFATAREFADALRDPNFRTEETAGVGAWAGSAGGSRRALAAVSGLALLLLVAALAGWLRPRPAAPVIRYGLSLPPSQAMLLGAPTPDVAPDGSFIVYLGPAAGGSQLWMKRRDSYTATPIQGTTGAASYTVSPDGGWIAFITNGRLSKVPIGGGSPLLLASDNVASTYGVAWLDDGSIVYPLRGAAGLMRVPAGGGTPSLIMRSDSLITLLPNALPGGHGIMFESCDAGCSTPDLWAVGLSGGPGHRLVPDAVTGVFVAPNHLVYGSASGALFVAPFDLKRLELTGPAVALDEQLATTGGTQQFHISASGTLVMLTGGAGATGRTFEMAWVDRTGRETPVDTSWTFQLTSIASNHGWALSPDGSRLAIGLSTPSGDDIWVKPLPAGAPYRVTFDPLPEDRPHWTPDNQYVTFVGIRRPGGIYRHRADGSGTDSLLMAGTMDEGVVSPDGRWLVLRQGSVGSVTGGRNITGVRLGTDTVPVPILSTEFDEEAIALSPDGRWIAYQSDETGRTEVFVRPFPNTDAGKRQVSSGGGVAPLWSRDGSELFFLSRANDMMAARMTASQTIDAGTPVALFHVRDALLGADATYYTPWDVARDGRFIMARLVTVANDDPGAIVVVENWLSDLRRKLKR